MSTSAAPASACTVDGTCVHVRRGCGPTVLLQVNRGAAAGEKKHLIQCSRRQWGGNMGAPGTRGECLSHRSKHNSGIACTHCSGVTGGSKKRKGGDRRGGVNTQAINEAFRQSSLFPHNKTRGGPIAHLAANQHRMRGATIASFTEGPSGDRGLRV